MALALAASAVAYIPAGVVQWPRTAPSLGVLGAVAVLAVVCTVAGFLLFSALIDEVGPVRATVITFVNPAVASILGVLVLGEAFTVSMGAGFLLVLLGSTLATRPGPRPEVRLGPSQG